MRRLDWFAWLTIASGNYDTSYLYDLDRTPESYSYWPTRPYTPRRPQRAYVLSIPATSETGAQTLLYELTGRFGPSSLLALDVYLYKHSKCDPGTAKVLEECEVVLNSKGVLASAGPCDLRPKAYEALGREFNQAVIPSLLYDQECDTLVRDIDNHYVAEDRSLVVDSYARSLKYQGYDTFYRVPVEDCVTEPDYGGYRTT